MEISEAEAGEIPLALLLEADPSPESISRYLDTAWRYVAIDAGAVIGACIVKRIDGHCAELFNIAVLPERQQGGVGAALLTYVLKDLKTKDVSRVELGTGTFGHQLSFYQRLGFRVDAVEKDYFLDNYAEPVIESGIRHKDRLRLSVDI